MAKTGYNYADDHDACGVGFLAQLGLPGSHELVERALEALARLAHRGGVDADGRSGDGAGLLTAIPQGFIRQCAREEGIHLPKWFGLGMAFITSDQPPVEDTLASAADQAGIRYLGSRVVPVDSSIIGPRSLLSLPIIRQFFFAPGAAGEDFEAHLFQLRKLLESTAPDVYFCSLSSRTIVYKGLLTPQQLPIFYPDLAHTGYESSFAIFHQRYSTNTRPSWRLAQPFRFVAHNGEINTITANRRWLRAHEPELRREIGLPDECALLERGMSDSASFDNSFEIQLRQGRSPAEAVCRLVPPAWERDDSMPTALRRLYEANAGEQEPWDGPAALIFSDGQTVGAKLDRNGLRPLRYSLTADGLLVVGSEVGILELHGCHVVERQRLGPGEVLIADPTNGIFYRPNEVAELIARDCRPISRMVIRPQNKVTSFNGQHKRLLAASGWTEDQFRMLFLPLVEDGQEALWSMGDDAPPAFLSNLPRPLWDYCKQRFAQVTNPPIDPLRESHVMSLDVYLGENLMLSSPLLDIGQLDQLRATLGRAHTIDFTFEAAGGMDSVDSALYALRAIGEQASAACASSRIIVLSDRGLSETRAALPALLAVSAVWKAMVRAGQWRTPLIVESAQVIDTHHFALLIASGASAVHPWLAMEMATHISTEGVAHYRAALQKGLRKVLARMGIATVASYRNGQLFETIGLDSELCRDFFEDAGQSLEGKNLTEVLQDYIQFHTSGFRTPAADFRDLGLYRFRHNGERHGNSPELVRRMHRYIQSPTVDNQAALAELGNAREAIAPRDLLEICPSDKRFVEEVETEASLLCRFSTQAMSLGAISPEAHRALAIAMNHLGGRSNTGEGGEDPKLYYDHPEANNRVKQVASGRFGVTAEYLVHADEIEIKMAQGSKPGEGGQLPAIKVSPYIARLRHAVPGTSLISPPPHHDIYSIEDLAQLIYDLRAVNPHARIGVKLVSSSGIGIIAAGVAKAGANLITVSGHDGGTGASPLTSIKNSGLPWEVGLRDAHCSLVRTGLRGRVRLRVDGGLKFARDVIVGALLGAEEFGFGTAALLAIGCVMARQCHLNTCPVGIATQDEKFRARFAGTPEMVESYFRALAAEVRELLASMGANSIDEIVGDTSRLASKSAQYEKMLVSLLAPAEGPQQPPCPREPESGLHLQLAAAIDDLDKLSTHGHHFRITNSDRAIGAHLAGEILRRRQGAEVAGAVACEFTGTAGQSFGSFLIPGLKLRLLGEANDYVGKGLSGGSITITAGKRASLRGDVLAGNTVLYGATAGELYVAGRAGERFAVRNSGALAVVEGVGQHGCEYMTAGVVVVLGPAGQNFGAGMTGGAAYMLRDTLVGHDYNQHSVRLVPIEVREELWLRMVLRRHLRLTESPKALQLVASDAPLPFLRVEPLNPACTIAETWQTTLAQLRGHELAVDHPAASSSKEPLVM